MFLAWSVAAADPLSIAVEGAITVGFAIVSWFLLPDYPATTRRLSTREKAMAVYRLERDVGQKDDDDVPLLTSVKMALADYRLYLLALIIITKVRSSDVRQRLVRRRSFANPLSFYRPLLVP